MPKKVKKLFTSVSFKQSLIVLVPMIIVSTFGVVFFSHSLVNGMKNEILRGMFSACASYRETITMRNGEADGSQLEDLLKADTGMDFTYFEGAERAATSILNADGQKPLGTKAAPEVISNVLVSGNVYSSTNTDVNGTPYYVVYMPVQKGGNVSGMAFVGLPRTSVARYVLSQTRIMMIVSVSFIIFIALLMYITTSRLISAVKESSEAIQKIAAGEMDVKLSTELLSRRDEFGFPERHQNCAKSSGTI